MYLSLVRCVCVWVCVWVYVFVCEVVSGRRRDQTLVPERRPMPFARAVPAERRSLLMCVCSLRPSGMDWKILVARG